MSKGELTPPFLVLDIAVLNLGALIEQVRSGCDLMHLFFMFDEYSDKCGPEEVWSQARIQMDAFANPQVKRPAEEWVGGEFTRQ